MSLSYRLGMLCALILPMLGNLACGQVPKHRMYGEWRSSVIGGGGYLQQVHFCPTDAKRLYMTSDVGGVFRSDDLGKTWRMLHGALPPGGGTYEIRGLATSPADADHVVIACGSPWGANKGIFVTRDGGKTWKQTLSAMFPGNGDTRGNGRILVPSPAEPRLLIAAADDGVYRSEDFGETWASVQGPTNLFSPSDVMFDRSNAQRVWLCVPGWRKERTAGLFISEDAGRTFRKWRDRSPSEMLQDPKDPSVLYGLFDQRPHRSTDLGRNWMPIDQSLPKANGAREDGSYAAIASNSRGEVILGGHGGNFYLLDRGSDSWKKVQRETVEEGDWWGRMRPGMYNHFGSALGYVVANPRDDQHWYFTDWYACYETRDGGANWALRIDGVEMTVIHTVVPDPNRPQLIHVGMADLGYFRSTDGGVSFSWNNNGISNNIKSIAPCAGKPGRMYAVGPKQWHWYANQVFMTDDFGETWQRLTMDGLPNMEEARCNTVVVHPKQPDVAYITVSGKVGPDGGGVYRWSGSGWEWVGEGLPAEDHLFRKDIWVHGPELAISPDGTLMAMSADRGMLFRLEGGQWQRVERPGGGAPNGIIADPSTPRRFYLAMKEGGLYRTNDAGRTWQRLIDANVHWVAVDARRPDHLAATTSTSVIASSDGGATWMTVGEGLPYRHPRNVVAVSEGKVYVGTGGNGVFWREMK